MASHNVVKVVKRAERERLRELAAGGIDPELSPRHKAREQAARVKEWVSEFEQTRPARLQEISRRLGRSEPEGDGLPHKAVNDSVESEK